MMKAWFKKLPLGAALALALAFGGASANDSGIVAGAEPHLPVANLSESISIKQFGAVGDGVTDDTAAFAKAIAALNGRGRLVVPRPAVAYKITGTIAIGSRTTDSNIVIDADPGTLIKSYLNGSNVLFDIKNTPGHFNLNGIRGLRMQSASAGNGVALQVNGQSFGTFDDLYIEGFKTGIALSNAGGAGIFTEFVRFNRIELHNNAVGLGFYKHDGDISFHGVSFANTTINIGAHQVGLDFVDASWYNASFAFRIFANDPSAIVLRMSTNAPTVNKGVFGEGSLTVEGPNTGTASITGTGRFWFDGKVNFMSGLTDNLNPVNAWEQGLSARNYLKSQSYGSTGYSVQEVRDKVPSYGFTSDGPFGSFARLTAPNVEALVANSHAAHAANAGNGFYTGYTGYRSGYSAAKLGWFLASDGTQIKSYAPDGTTVSFNAGANGNPNGDNQAYSIRDGNFYVGGAHIAAGNGSPNGVVAGKVGDMYLNRTGTAGQVLWIKEGNSGGNTGWVAK